MEMRGAFSKLTMTSRSQSGPRRALRESEERFRAIVETTPECVKLISADGTLLHMNGPAWKWLVLVPQTKWLARVFMT